MGLRGRSERPWGRGEGASGEGEENLTGLPGFVGRASVISAVAFVKCNDKDQCEANQCSPRP